MAEAKEWGTLDQVQSSPFEVLSHRFHRLAATGFSYHDNRTKTLICTSGVGLLAAFDPGTYHIGKLELLTDGMLVKVRSGAAHCVVSLENLHLFEVAVGYDLDDEVFYTMSATSDGDEVLARVRDILEHTTERDIIRLGEKLHAMTPLLMCDGSTQAAEHAALLQLRLLLRRMNGPKSKEV